jgi:hypothetical protein
MKTWIIGITKEGCCGGGGIQHEPEAYALDSAVRIVLANEDQELQDELDLMLWFSNEPGDSSQTLYDCKIVDGEMFASAFREAHVKAVQLNKKEPWYQEAKS